MKPDYSKTDYSNIIKDDLREFSYMFGGKRKVLKIGDPKYFYNWYQGQRQGGLVTGFKQYPAGMRIYFTDNSSCLEQDLT